MRYTTEQLTAIGGREWQGRRVYLNAPVLAELVGFSVVRYGSGNIQSASLRGESVSNNRARQLDSELATASVYYDVATGAFHGRCSRETFDAIVAGVADRVRP